MRRVLTYLLLSSSFLIQYVTAVDESEPPIKKRRIGDYNAAPESFNFPELPRELKQVVISNLFDDPDALGRFLRTHKNAADLFFSVNALDFTKNRADERNYIQVLNFIGAYFQRINSLKLPKLGTFLFGGHRFVPYDAQTLFNTLFLLQGLTDLSYSAVPIQDMNLPVLQQVRVLELFVPGLLQNSSQTINLNLRQFPNLTALMLNAEHFGNRWDLTALNTLPNLKVLKIHNTMGHNSLTIENLQVGYAQWTNLEILELQGVSTDDDFIAFMAQQCPNLKQLMLSNMGMDITDLTSLGNFNKLERLVLNNNITWLEDDEFDTFLDGIVSIPTLQELEIRYLRLRNDSTNLGEVDDDEFYGDENLEYEYASVMILKNCPKLQRLNNLRSLKLRGVYLAQEEIELIQNSLPGVNVTIELPPQSPHASVPDSPNDSFQDEDEILYTAQPKNDVIYIPDSDEEMEVDLKE